MISITARLFQVAITDNIVNRLALPSISNGLLIRNYAARKGTRERKQKAKVKKEIVKVGFIPHNQRNKDKLLVNRPTRKFDDSWKRDPMDNVYAMKYYKWIVYPFADAVKAHRETHHPEMYNQPNANVHVTIELNMQGEKKTRFVDNFKRIAGIKHKFDHGEERTVIVFAKNDESQREAVEAGANLVGGVELIKQIQNGQVSLTDYQYPVAHPDILPELVVLRGILKRRFPNPKAGTLDPDVKSVVDRLLHGISYGAEKDEYEKDFGAVNAIIGTLNMDEKHLEENFASLVKDVYTQKPRREGHFISRCILWSPPSKEKLNVEYKHYLTEDTSKPQKQTEDDDEVEAVAL